MASLVASEYDPPPGGPGKVSITENRVGHPLKSGYTGFVPRAKNHHFGETYGAVTYRALAEAEQIRRKTQAERTLFATYATQRAGVAARTGGATGSNGATGQEDSLKNTRDPYASTSLSYRPLQVADYSLRTLDELGASADAQAVGGEGGEEGPGGALDKEEEVQGFDLEASRQVGATAASAKRTRPGFDMHAMATSPYRLPSGHPQKYFIPSYTGYVPTSQNQIGKNFSDTTRAALAEFDDDCTTNNAGRAEANPDLLASIRDSYYAGGIAKPPPPAAPSSIRPVPGSTVHIPNAIHTIGVTYGSLVDTES